MDKIIGYSDDELLVKILSFLPTKVAVSTSILSKHWKFLWMHVPKLDYDDVIIKYNPSKCESLRRFIAMNLPIHRAPVIESLRINLLTVYHQHEDIKRWVEIAVSRCVRELSICCYGPIALLPNSLYTCKSLVILKLSDQILVDVPRVASLPSLKTLHLQYVKYANKESLQSLLSNCSILEDLIVDLCVRDNVRKFTISSIPTLLSFTISGSRTCDEYVIDTPSLKYFKATDFTQTSYFFIVNTPKLEEADIDFDGFPDIKRLLEPVNSVKRLSLSTTRDNNAEVVYGDDIVFHELEHLKFCIDNTYQSKLLHLLLRGSPKLRHFEFDVSFFDKRLLFLLIFLIKGNFSQDGMETMDTSVYWKQLNYVPQCLLSSLQTFKWTCYNPTTEEIDMATYILRNSCRLKTARFLIRPSWLDPQKKLEMKNELASSSRGSTTCNLSFNNFD